MNTEVSYPATHTVHCPNGPTDACEKHARGIVGLMNFLGTHVVCTPAADDAQCANCHNESKLEK